MAENLMNSSHKATNKPFRDNYDNMTWGGRIPKSTRVGGPMKDKSKYNRKRKHPDRIHPENNRDN